MKNSKQRNAIYDVVRNSKDHPDAQTILERVNKVMSSINLATVYRNLAYLQSQGLIKRIPIESGDRFDYNTKDHSHFYCLACNCVFDVEIEGMDCYHDLIIKKYNCKIEAVDNLIKGYCYDCYNNVKNKEVVI